MPIVPSLIQKRGMGYKQILPVDMALLVLGVTHLYHFWYWASYFRNWAMPFPGWSFTGPRTGTGLYACDPISVTGLCQFRHGCV